MILMGVLCHLNLVNWSSRGYWVRGKYLDVEVVVQTVIEDDLFIFAGHDLLLFWDGLRLVLFVLHAEYKVFV